MQPQKSFRFLITEDVEQKLELCVFITGVTNQNKC